MQFNQRGIHITNMNIRHLKRKLDDMKILLDSGNCIDVFGLCETFLTETVDNDILSISGYTFECKERWETNSSSNKGGRILIYLNNNMNYNRRKDIDCNTKEYVWVKIRLRNSKKKLTFFFYAQHIDHRHQMQYGVSISLNKSKKHAIL